MTFTLNPDRIRAHAAQPDQDIPPVTDVQLVQIAAVLTFDPVEAVLARIIEFEDAAAALWASIGVGSGRGLA